jgi:hypothetical protein
METLGVKWLAKMRTIWSTISRLPLLRKGRGFQGLLSNDTAKLFVVEEGPIYTKKESELIQVLLVEVRPHAHWQHRRLDDPFSTINKKIGGPVSYCKVFFDLIWIRPEGVHFVQSEKGPPFFNCKIIRIAGNYIMMNRNFRSRSGIELSIRAWR